MNTQLREAVLSGQVSAAQVVQHQLAGELPIQMLDAQDPAPPDCWERCARVAMPIAFLFGMFAGTMCGLSVAIALGWLS